MGKSEEELEVFDGIIVRDFIEILKECYFVFKNEVFVEDDDFVDVNVFRNGCYVRFDEVLKDGDVIVIFLFVSGG